MELLISTLGFVFRSIDGRQNAPKYWNVYIYLGLLTILSGYVYLEYMTAIQALGIYAVVLTYILSGYKSLTLPWVLHLYNLYEEKRLKKFCEMFSLKYGVIFHGMNISKLTREYEKYNGFHTWHMSYRYVIAGALICAILGTWSVPYLIACSVAGLLFPISVRLLEYIPEGKRDFWGEVFAKFREGNLGAVVIGGFPWLI